MKPKKAKIRITKNGPYVISGSLPLNDYAIVLNEKNESIRWEKGKQYDTPETYLLCRCGRSKKMPFCDGSHHIIEFEGEETAKKEKYIELAEKIEGPEIDLLDEKDLCAEARFCDAGKKTWHLVHEDDKTPEKEIFLQQCADCPSGRYTAITKDGKMIEPVFEPSLGIVHDPTCLFGGPIWVRGGVPIESVEGYPYEIRNRRTLCRCGLSKNKPFCDGSHLQVESTKN